MQPKDDDTTRGPITTWNHWHEVQLFFNSCLGIAPSCKVKVKKEQAGQLKIFGFTEEATEHLGETIILTHQNITRTGLENLWKAGIPLEELTVTM
ncbi:MAG: hypothetical protein RIQ54_59 [Candidatus Parcubacteria bacterium]